MFALARRHSISIIRMVFPLDDFKRFLLQRSFAIIVLVNAELLQCECCSNTSSAKVCRVPSLGVISQALCWRTYYPTIEYAGHYIVLIGYEPSSDCFIYRDPAARAHFCMISASKFEVARRFLGTDDDWYVPIFLDI
ncbi:hypothetical protein DSO57_1034062 [Entomophthora muscae]|uniref:Uncharacterized protein n=1 Tax=Entomophthora muscae TaxID=34485 RepID=A0ACC2SCY2_9FUNG|nr:hypothetical protein DSO57_1034062 [Entomophthora muscae]